MITIIPTRDNTKEKVWIFGDSFGDPHSSNVPWTYTCQLKQHYQLQNYCISGSSPLKMLNELFKKIAKHKRKPKRLKEINLIFLLSYTHRFDFKPFEPHEASNFSRLFYNSKKEVMNLLRGTTDSFNHTADRYLPYYNWAQIYAQHHRIPYNVDEIDDIRNLQTLIAQGKLFKKVLIIQIPPFNLIDTSSYTNIFLRQNNGFIFDNVSVNEGPGLALYINKRYTDSRNITFEQNNSYNHLSEKNHLSFYEGLSLWINKTEASSFSTKKVLKQEVLDFG